MDEENNRHSAYYYRQIESLYVSFWHATNNTSCSNGFSSSPYLKGEIIRNVFLKTRMV